MSRREPIRVLVIDDSAYSRRTIVRMLETSPLVEVIDWARDGEEALRKTLELGPDLVTLDLEMPRMDGFTFLRLVMARCPTPVLVVSGRAEHQDVFKALDLGAVDFVAKPTVRATPELGTIQQELIRKVHAIRELRIDKVTERIDAAPVVVPVAGNDQDPGVVAIGSSTGGPAALLQILGAFTEPPHASFAISQHMPMGFTQGFAQRLDRLTHVTASEACGGELMQPGHVLIAPGGSHLEFESDGHDVRAIVVPSDEGDKYAPSVDRMFQSAAKHFGEELTAVVLTGMGDDGREGVVAVHQCGGTVIAESEETAVIHGMPLQAIRTGVVDTILPLGEIAAALEGGRPGPGDREGSG